MKIQYMSHLVYINYEILILFLLGLISMFFSIRSYLNIKRLEKTGKRTIGKVIEVSEEDGYRSVILFTDDNNQAITVNLSFIPSRKNSSVRVVYNPLKSDKENYIDTFDGKFSNALILAMLSLFFLGAVIIKLSDIWLALLL